LDFGKTDLEDDFLDFGKTDLEGDFLNFGKTDLEGDFLDFGKTDPGGDLLDFEKLTLKERWTRMRKARETRLKRLHTTFSTDLNQSEFSIYFSTAQPIRIQYLLQHRSTNQNSVLTSTPLNQSEFSIYFQHRSTSQHSGIV
jgi:hypothetical protein